MGSRRGRAIFVAMAAAHGALLLLLTLGLKPRDPPPMEPALAIAPVYLAEIRRKPRPKPASDTPLPSAAAPLPVLARAAEPLDRSVEPEIGRAHV